MPEVLRTGSREMADEEKGGVRRLAGADVLMILTGRTGEGPVQMNLAGKREQ
jgi:hypothetical protein